MTEPEIKRLSNNNLIDLAKKKAREEQMMTLQVIRLLAEIYDRRLFLQYGYESIHEFVVKHLGYSDQSASSRIRAMRLILDCPEVEEKIQSGALNLTVVAKAQSFFDQESNRQKKNQSPPAAPRPIAKEMHQESIFDLTNSSNSAENESQLEPRPQLTPNNPPKSSPAPQPSAAPAIKLDRETKSKILKRLEGKSTRAAEQELSSLSSKTLPNEKVRPLSHQHDEFKLVVPKQVTNKLVKLKSILSHKHPRLSHSELLEILADFALSHWDPEKEPARKAKGLQKRSTSEAKRSETSLTSQAQSHTQSQNSTSELALKESAPQVFTSQQATQSRDPSPALNKQFKEASIAPTSQLVKLEHERTNLRKYISVHSRRTVFQRAETQCEWKDSKTGKRCESRHQLEIDHIISVSQGGTNDLENLRLLCRQHNMWAATQRLGHKKMSRYRSIDPNPAR